MYWLDPCTYYSMILKEQIKENNMENKMGHFIGWKFGVPVNVFHHGYIIKDCYCLTHESDVSFRVVNSEGGGTYYPKSDGYTYELIPHKNLFAAFSPRYPVCQSPARTAYCNSGIGEPQMNQIDSCGTNDLSPYSTATLTIDGKIIELSAETTAELKKKLGI